MLLCQASLGSKLQLLQYVAIGYGYFFLCFTWIGQLGPVKAAPSDRYTLGAVNVRLGQPPGERIQ